MSDQRSLPWLRRHFGRARKSQEQVGGGVRSTEAGRSAASRAEPNVSAAPPRREPSPLTGDSAAATVATTTPAEAEGIAPSLPERLWDRAYDALKEDHAGLVEAYEKILSSQLERGLGSTVPESQQNAIAQHDPDARRRQMVQLVLAGRDRTTREAKLKSAIGTSVQAVLSLKDTVSLAIQAVPQAALAWSGVCIAMEMLVNPIKQTEANRNGVEHVIKSMDWYWSLSSSLLRVTTGDGDGLSEVRRQLETQIVDLYRALLSYQMKSVYSYYRHRGLVFLRDIVKLDDWDGDQKAILDAEARFRHYTKAYTTQQTNSHLQLASSRLEQLVTNQLSEKDHQCLKDLRLTDPRDDKTRIEQTKGGLLRDSYRWILDNPDFRRWRSDAEHRLLWIKGDPGKGKTMLLCGIIDEVKSTSSVLLSFFLCQATDARINNANAVLRGLIYVLVHQKPSLLSYVRKRYDEAGKPLFEDVNAWVALSEIFSDILQDPVLEDACIVIDALDECVTDLPRLLEFIARSTSFCRAKWIVSSRNWRDIEEVLDNTTQKVRLCLELNESSISAAVETYIQFKVDDLAQRKKYDLPTRDAVQQYLISNANDTFLWVALVCQELADSKVRKRHTMQILDTFPPGLDSLYQRMMEHIDPRDAELCHQILALLSVTYRPLALIELMSLIQFEDVGNDLESWAEIIGSCGSFLTLRDDAVYFVHQSAKDFLLSKAVDEIFPRGKESEHHRIVSNSLETLSAVLRRDIYDLHAPGFPIDQVVTPNPDPLARVRYSCVYWVDHLCDWLSTAMEGQEALRDDGTVHTFFHEKYLFWLEALSLLRSMSMGVIAMRKLEDLSHEKGQRFAGLLTDARRFILSHKWIIENVPLQTYASALVFSPVRSEVRALFQAEEPSWITLKPIVDADWSACLQTLMGHSKGIESVAFSPDGTKIASGSADKTAKIWDTALGTCLQTLRGHSKRVESVAFSPDGKQAVSSSEDRTIKLWDTASGDCTQTLEGHGGSVYSVAFSPDGKQLVSSSADKTVKLWDTASGNCAQTLEGHGGWVYSVAFSPDGKQVVSSSEDRTIKLWDTTSGNCTQTLEGNGDSVYSVAFSPNGKQLASVSGRSHIEIWDAISAKRTQTLEGDKYLAHSVAFSPDSQLVASGSRYATIRIWDTSSGKAQILQGHNNSINSVAFSPVSKLLASASDDHSIKLWNLTLGPYTQTAPSDPVCSVAFSPDAKYLVSVSNNDTAKLWDAASGKCVRAFEDWVNWGPTVFSPDGQLLAFTSFQDGIRIWDIILGKYAYKKPDGYSSVDLSMVFSPDGKQLALTYKNNAVILDTASGACACTLKGHRKKVRSVAYSPDGKQLASASEDMTVKVWDMASGACLRTLEAYGSWVRLVAFSPNASLNLPT
ncbi:WD40 repeat-like protein [Pleurostoma richardsiae]|uniref:WD40 repeat-like protein n=1 Tax=Pleurostoma richardsiae TaxID=41990 RepID=A0AA38RLT5_9PEZI|nr:WD40 repeat-like protein [Pleurostoma richardsiae]